MQLEQPLTRENFWDDIMKQFPKSMNLFCNWIDEYKAAVHWNMLFGNQTYFRPKSAFVKFHSIPYAMQQGIWIEFVGKNLDNFFEQPEYTYSGDLAEDIKTVFSEIEELIDEEQLPNQQK